MPMRAFVNNHFMDALTYAIGGIPMVTSDVFKQQYLSQLTNSGTLSGLDGQWGWYSNTISGGPYTESKPQKVAEAKPMPCEPLPNKLLLLLEEV